MKKSIIFSAFLLFSSQLHSMQISPSPEMVNSLTNIIKTSGITAVGIVGATTGFYLIANGWKKAFLDEDKKRKSFYNNNITKGLFSTSCGVLTTIASTYLILKSNHLAEYYS